MSKIKTLIVEDNLIFLNLMKEYFSNSTNIEVLYEAGNGVEAYNIVDKYICDIDIILLDLIMPKKDGLYVLKKMKENNLIKDIIVTSAFGEEDVIMSACEYGVKYFLLKPFDFEDLENKIIEIFNYNRSSHISSKKILDIKKVLADFLHSLGFPSHLKGYQYIREAILLVLEKPELSLNITRCLYQVLGDNFNTSKENIERSIRHAIEISWNRGDIDLIDKVFGRSIDINKSKPTNLEYITTLVDFIKLGKLSDID